MIKLVQITRELNNSYSLSQIYLNPSHIIYMSEDTYTKRHLDEGQMRLGIDKEATFTKIKINENSKISEIIVVGSPSAVEAKIISNTKKQLLRG